jgi:hypothetical protein
MLPQLAATLACAILAGLGAFQLALAAGLPLGDLAWGGYHTVLPAGLRAASALSIAVYGAITAVVLAGAGRMRLPFPPWFIRPALLALTAFFCLGTFMNLASQSFWERAIMTPLAFTLAACCYVLARAIKP